MGWQNWQRGFLEVGFQDDVLGGGGGGGASAYVDLTDTPGAHVANELPVVNAAGSALEYPGAAVLDNGNDRVIFGRSITVGGGTGHTLIGHGISVSGGSSQSVFIGHGATDNGSGASNSVAVGPFAVVQSGDTVAVGGAASATGTDCTAVGRSSSASGLGTTAVGNDANAAGNSNQSAFGDSASATGDFAQAIGASALADGDNSLAVGMFARVDAAHTGSIAIGRAAITDAANQLVLGGNTDITDAVIGGSGPTDASPPDVIWRTTSATGTDVAGSDVTIQAGRSTGSGIGGSLLFQVSPAGAPGSALNAASTVLELADESGARAIGFFGATPIAQPSSTGENAGHSSAPSTSINLDDTFTGNVGATAYTLSDIVKHLKNLGLIAQ